MKPLAANDDISTQELAAELWALLRTFEAVSTSMSRRCGLSAEDHLLVRMASHYEWIGEARLARLLCVEPDDLVVSLRRLAAAGHVRRARRGGARPSSVVVVTPSGRRLATEDPASIEAALRRLLRRTTDDTVASTRKLLVSLRASLLRHLAQEPKRRTVGGRARIATK